MDKIHKFLLKLSKKERLIFSLIFQDIVNLNLDNYDTKALKVYKNLFLLKKEKIRIVYTIINQKGRVLDIDYRKDIYR
jgi:mRNA-degrading endonuclease RelE of RelBE toxin-antitoxin system